MGAVRPGEWSAPEKLSIGHDLSTFESGELVLDEWLRLRAAKNELSGASRTYVACCGKKAAGFYSLAVGAIAHDQAPGRIKRNTPDPIPVMILRRLAVDRSFQGIGVRPGLLRDALSRTIQAAEIAGIQAFLAHAISEEAKRFYLRFGFVESPIDRMTVMISLPEAARTFRIADR